MQEKLRQQQKAKAEKDKHHQRTTMQATFEQHRSLHFEEAEFPMRKDSDFDRYLRSLSIEGISEKKQDAGFESFRHTLSIDSTSETEMPMRKESGFEQYSRSLSISRKQQPHTRRMNDQTGHAKQDSGIESQGRSVSDSCIAKHAEKEARSKIYRRCRSDDVACPHSALKASSQAQITSGNCFDSCEHEDEFSQASTTAGSYADEGPFDDRRVDLHGGRSDKVSRI